MEASQSTSIEELQLKLRDAIHSAGLSPYAAQILAAAKPAILLELSQTDESAIPVGASKIGGRPDLPTDYLWPEWQGNPMGFMGQVDLANASRFDLQGLLPTEGLLSFFYDLHKQPWGYDPKEFGFSRVEYFLPQTSLTRRDVPEVEIYLKCSGLNFSFGLTLPINGSQAWDLLEQELELNNDDQDKYWNLSHKLSDIYRQQKHLAHHQLLGHSFNIQGDMQLQAELVTNGLYYGDPTGYDDPRARALEPLSAEWELLFQLDSDDTGELLWGDNGMLYYWLRRSDLINCKFEKHWMISQCF